MAPKIATHTRIASPSASPDGRGAAGDLCIQEFIEAGVLLAWFWHQSVSAASSRLRLFSNEHQHSNVDASFGPSIAQMYGPAVRC